jgi:hypothetical protein
MGLQSGCQLELHAAISTKGDSSSRFTDVAVDLSSRSVSELTHVVSPQGCPRTWQPDFPRARNTNERKGIPKMGAIVFP